MFEDGTTEATEIDVPAKGRANVSLTPATIAQYPELASFFPSDVVAAGRRFGVVVDSLPTASGTAQVVVEGSIYGSDGRVPTFLPYWPAGSNALATRLQ